ncbi:MAG TPA: hypothetical protein VGO04_23440 [Ensifer sp.]|jgi:hypothetical protein|uniref:hypothetical protein n=1 Tax=Ensifer sp. TaxID=1872086 RepID=UPI002E11F070|nr:hypothetical protein [Ensifer sp.]
MKKVRVALDAVVGIVLNILDIIVLGFLLHRVARLIVPLFSFGRVQVEDVYASGSDFNWLGLKREQDGRLLLNSDMSMVAAALFWVLCLIAYLAVTRGF